MLNLKTLAVAAACAVLASGASYGATVNDYERIFSSNGAPPPGVTECGGDFGNPPDCVYYSVDNYYFDGAGPDATNAAYDSNDYGALSLLAKYDFGTFPEATTTLEVLGGTFTFDIVDGKLQWTYDPGSSLYAVFAFVAKGGNGYSVYEKGTAPENSGFLDFANGWASPQGSNPSDISHMTFYGKELAAIPLPAGGVLLLTALGGLALARRRKA